MTPYSSSLSCIYEEVSNEGYDEGWIPVSSFTLALIVSTSYSLIDDIDS